MDRNSHKELDKKVPNIPDKSFSWKNFDFNEFAKDIEEIGKIIRKRDRDNNQDER